MNLGHLRHLSPNVIAICGGILSSILSLLPLHFNILSFFMNYFAALPLFFVGMCWGGSHLMIAAIVSIGIFLIWSGFYSSLVFVITTLLPAFLIIDRFQKGDSAGYIISWVTGLAIVIFMGVLLILSTQSANVLDLLRSWLSLFMDEEAFKALQGQVIPLIPGISSISWLVMCFVNASIAQQLAIKAKLSQRPYPLLKDTQLYEHWDLVLGVGLLLTLTSRPLLVFMGKNVALISCFPIFLVGLKVIYTWLEEFENPKLWLIGVVIISIFLVWPAIFVVILGVLEPTLHFSQKGAPNKS